MNFIERLEELRTEKGVTKTKLLNDCGLAKNSITYWEKHKTIPTTPVLVVLSKYLGVSVDYLKGETDKKEKPITDDGDELSQEFKSLYRQLTQEQKEILLAAMREFAKGK